MKMLDFLEIFETFGSFRKSSSYNFESRRQIMKPGGVYYVTEMVVGLCFTLHFFVNSLPHQIGLYKRFRAEVAY